MGVAWNGGDIVRYPGGGHKINLLRPIVEKWKDEKNLIVMFVDRFVRYYILSTRSIIRHIVSFSLICTIVYSIDLHVSVSATVHV